MKTWQTILSIVISISTVIGIGFMLDSRWAKAMELKRLELRLDQKITVDRMDAIQERVWKLEDRYQPSPYNQMPESVKEEYRRLLNEKNQLEEDINQMKEHQ